MVRAHPTVPPRTIRPNPHGVCLTSARLTRHLRCACVCTPACQDSAVHPQFAQIAFDAFGGIDDFFRIRNFGFGLMLATALAASVWSSAGQAYTPEQEQACTGDAFRLCSPEIPDVDRVTACMVRRSRSSRRAAARISGRIPSRAGRGRAHQHPAGGAQAGPPARLAPSRKGEKAGEETGRDLIARARPVSSPPPATD